MNIIEGSIIECDGRRVKIRKIIDSHSFTADWKDKDGMHTGLFHDMHHDHVDIDVSERNLIYDRP